MHRRLTPGANEGLRKFGHLAAAVTFVGRGKPPATDGHGVRAISDFGAFEGNLASRADAWPHNEARGASVGDANPWFCDFRA